MPHYIKIPRYVSKIKEGQYTYLDLDKILYIDRFKGCVIVGSGNAESTFSISADFVDVWEKIISYAESHLYKDADENNL
jgi:hypothetical protein